VREKLQEAKHRSRERADQGFGFERGSHLTREGRYEIEKHLFGIGAKKKRERLKLASVRMSGRNVEQR
jgi:hypothetical protein